MNAILPPLATEDKNSLSIEALQVREALINSGVETPIVKNTLEHNEKYQIIKDSMENILEVLGLDLSDDSLIETPHRIAKMYLSEIFSGLDYSNFPKITCINNKMNIEEMVTINDISLVSTCEHHFITIDGFAKVSYIPKNKVIGLSKVNRLVKFFAQRPQVQERLTQQVLIALQTLLETQDVAVSIRATHYCVKARGIMDTSSYTTTTSLGGAFKIDDKTRSEFLKA
jgi:GTP cyclohydrolase I